MRFFFRLSGFQRIGAFLFAPLLLLTACDSLSTRQLKKVELQVGSGRVMAEVALTEEDRRRGLMYRSSLGDDEGMLFVFPEEKALSFWMKNTEIPLDVGFFDAQGFLISYATMVPDDGKKLYSSPEPALYALEMNAGWYNKKGIRKYDRLILPRPLKGE